MKAYKQNIQGFTFIEMSVVVLVIGLIVAAVMGGANFLQAAKINKAISDLKTIDSAINMFELRYDALPGDMPNAFDYWGASSGPGNCTDAASPTGCNGNGNNSINEAEGFRAWQQLGLAGMYKGDYVGVISETAPIVIGVEAPAGAFDGTGYGLRAVTAYDRINQNAIEFGASKTSATYNTFNRAIIDVEDADTIDKKMDDDNAITGDLRGLSCTGVVFNDLTGTGAYQLTTSGSLCSLNYFILQ